MSEEHKVELKAIWRVLDDINSRVKELDNKWDIHASEDTKAHTEMSSALDQIDLLNKLMMTGNGQKSVLVQLGELKTQMLDVKDEIEHVSTDLHHMSQKSQTSVTKARWVALGKVAGILTLAIPGILSYFGG